MYDVPVARQGAQLGLELLDRVALLGFHSLGLRIGLGDLVSLVGDVARLGSRL
jgi:hypothetical protein